jgi:hypothetical protein
MPLSKTNYRSLSEISSSKAVKSIFFKMTVSNKFLESDLKALSMLKINDEVTKKSELGVTLIKQNIS